jgi:hypothetical protein
MDQKPKMSMLAWLSPLQMAQVHQWPSPGGAPDRDLGSQDLAGDRTEQIGGGQGFYMLFKIDLEVLWALIMGGP